ncbi:MAG: hypothetical protein KDI24_01105 [Pseudomonadales bacterium]|nr:hypothetical protein [Pseudomonadales bacterium]MCP5172951.1 hypothetical protein [Pseudomonadales bacterium]MCP5302424.1 hypothetical protein [Pseudomonadales bacterium]
MTKRTRNIAIAYGVWATAFFLVAVYGALFFSHGEYGVSAHLWLTLTGMPLSFVSWGVPHGTALGVAVAGVAGIIQWSAMSEFWACWDRRKGVEKNET